MIEIIAGEKGKGKTKELLAKVNHSVAAAYRKHCLSGQKPEAYVRTE